MKAEQAKKLADEGLTKLAQALQQGKSETLIAYLTAMGRFHQYSFGNVMLILMQKPDAARVAGFNTWKKLGRFVKKGERGIAIIAPMVIKPRTDDSDPDVRDDEHRTVLRFKAVYVFDVSQTDGQPLPEFACVAGNPNGHTERLKAFVQERSIKLEYTNDIGSAQGASAGGCIKLRTDLAPAEEFSTLVHEVAHEMLHRRDTQERPSKTVRETEAEAVAFVVSQAIGLDIGTAGADYIQLYGGNADMLGASLDRIQKTAAEIIAAVVHDERAGTE